ncbi:MAG: hypothetical protein JJU45_13150 [Acidimicrobiia bacterium]|nr:hypothetical protein [Acidimicrobiia bacterium]
MARVTERSGIVEEFDEDGGQGTIVEPSGARWWFHCTAVSDGSRTIPTDTAVAFTLVPGHLGRFEPTGVRPL